MAIAPTTGANVNNAVATATLTFGAVSLTTGRDIVVAISLADTTKSVSTITDTALNTYTQKASASDGANIAVEIWEAHNITGNAADVILVTFSGATLASACFEEYSGVSSVGHAGGGNTGNSVIAETLGVALQDSNNWLIGVIGFNSHSGDTLSTAGEGTLRRSTIPALTTAGTAMLDQASFVPLTMLLGERISTARAYAACAVELRSGGAAATYENYTGQLPITSDITLKDIIFKSYTMPDGGGASPGSFGIASAQVRDGSISVAYTDTIVSIGGSSPYTYAVTSGSLPAALSLNSSTGVISGTPTTAAVSSFTITATDAHGFTAARAFSITIDAGGSGGSFAFVG